MKAENERLDSTLRFLGLCRRAGKTVCGTPLVADALASRKRPYLVVYALSASEGTKKKITNKCMFYRVPVLALEVATDVLAHAVGKTGDLAAVAVTDAGMAENLVKIYAEGKDAAHAAQG